MDVKYGPDKGSINIKPLEFGVVVSHNAKGPPTGPDDYHPGAVFTELDELVKFIEHFLLFQDEPRKRGK